MRRIFPFFAAALLVCLGCTKRVDQPTTRTPATTQDYNAAPHESPVPNGLRGSDKHLAGVPRADLKDQANEMQPEQKAKGEKPRKITYNADLSVIVEELDKAESGLDDARKAAKGEYAKVEVVNSATTVRQGTWRIRVPVDNLNSFRKAVARLGAVERSTVDSEDLTAQYYDLKAHIDNRKAAREALRDLLKETGKQDMKYYLEIWHRLESMTDEINRKQGQLNLWADLTDLTTCTVKLREKEKFIKDKPPEGTESPTFEMRAGKRWDDSWEVFFGFCQGVAIAAITMTPWLPFLLVVGLCAWLTARRLWRTVLSTLHQLPKRVAIAGAGDPLAAPDRPA
jgi:hypothetical protein